MAMEDATLVKYNSASYVLRAQTDAGTAGVSEFPLRGEMVVGREMECAIPLNSSHISRYHAKINVSSNGVYIEDLHSTNGTYVNGQRIKGRVRLSLGDEVAFDDLGFRLTSQESGGTQDTLLSMPAQPQVKEEAQPRALRNRAAPPVHPIFYPSYAAQAEPEVEVEVEDATAPFNPKVLDELDQLLKPEREDAPSEQTQPVALQNAPEDPPSVQDLPTARPSAPELAQDPVGLDGKIPEHDRTQFMPDVRMDELIVRSRGHQQDLNIGSGPRLIVLSAPLRGKWFELSSAPTGKTWRIGRDSQADICLSDKTISTDHARLTKTADGYQLAASHAKNGLLVNAHAKNQVSLRHNDRIQIGGTELVFRDDELGVKFRPVRAPDEQSQVWHYTIMGIAIILVIAVTALFALGG